MPIPPSRPSRRQKTGTAFGPIVLLILGFFVVLAIIAACGGWH